MAAPPASERAPARSLRIVASRPDPAIVTLPWHLPLDEWTEHVVPLPRGLSRHVVRIVRLGDRTYAVKETVADMAFREYRLLRDLQRIPLPAVVPQGVVTGRVDADGETLPPPCSPSTSPSPCPTAACSSTACRPTTCPR